MIAESIYIANIDLRYCIRLPIFAANRRADSTLCWLNPSTHQTGYRVATVDW